MFSIITYAKPKNDFLTIRVPDGYDTCSFKVVLFPMEDTVIPLDVGKWGLACHKDSSLLASGKLEKANEDLMSLAGTWVADPEAEKVFDEMRTVDAGLWQ